MRAFAALALLMLASLSGCAACCSPYDYTYPVLNNGGRSSCCRDGCSNCFHRSGSRGAMLADAEYIDDGYVGDEYVDEGAMEGEIVEEYYEQ